MTAKTSPQHAARNTSESIMKDLHDGFMEGFGYWDRNGKHRAVEAFNPMTGITTVFKNGVTTSFEDAA